METETEQTSGGGRRLLRVLGIGVVVLLVLCVVAYFVISSSGFVKGVVLPRVSKALHADLTVGDVSFSPLSQLTLDRLKIQAPGAEPVLTADRVRVRYSLFSILGGRYAVDELTVTAPVVQVIKNAKGVSNLDPLLQPSQGGPSGAKSSGPLKLAVRNVSVQNGAVHLSETAPDGTVQSKDLTQLNVTLDRLENGQSGKLTVASAAVMAKRLPVGRPGTNDLFESKLQGTFDFKLDDNLLPQNVTGNARIDSSRTEGAYAELAGLAGALQIESTPTEVRQLALRFEHDGKALGRVEISGPLDLSKTEGRLKVAVLSLDRQVLNLFAASHALDVGDSTLNSTNYVELAKGGELVSLRGQLAGRQLGVRSGATVTPPVDLDLDYEVSVNRHDDAAVVSKFDLVGRQGQQPFLSAGLDRPMNLTWATGTHRFPPSSWKVNLTRLDLSGWQGLIGTNVSSGQLDLALTLDSDDQGRQLKAQAKAQLANASIQVGTNRLQQTELMTSLQGHLDDFKTLTVDSLQMTVRQADRPLFKADGNYHGTLGQGDLNAQASAELTLPNLLRQFPVAGLTSSNGVVRLSAAVTRKDQRQSVTGNLLLGDFTGTYGSYVFDKYDASLDYTLNLEGSSVEVDTAALTLRRGYQSGGIVSLSGAGNLTNHSGQVTFKLVNLNQNGLDPVVGPTLKPKQLVSISLNGSGAASYTPQGDANLKADLSVTNWVVADPEHQFTSPNLSAQTSLDGSLHQQVLDLRKLLLSLSPTTRASNQVQVTAHLDMNGTNATPSQVSLEADSLDLTPYYDVLANKSKTNAPAVSPTPPAAGPPAEPAAMHLPIQQLTANAKIGKLFLHEVGVTNLQMTGQLIRDELTVNPLQMSVNGGPVSGNAKVNLGVAGYVYDVSFTADRVPLAPLANSFTTNAPGTYKGDVFSQIHLKGAGITDPSLRKNLNGSLGLSLTNMQYEVLGEKTKRLLTPVALALNTPELLQTPINWIGAQAEVGTGKINLQNFTVQSQAFLAESHGEIPMAEVLTNSPLNLPISLSLRSSLAERTHLAAVGSPTNSAYAALPSFVTLAGTIGDPKTEINKLAMAGMLTRVVGNIPQLGGNAGTILKGVGNMLTPATGKAATNAPISASTNAAATLIQNVEGLFNRPSAAPATNSPATRSTNAPAKSSVVDLLKLIPERK